ncbi:MAG TPA: tryptophan 2,3-dioxygenase family protein [bacterium]|nr:tryptophan 2,3-dioxygenase family protein [bacterium]
MDAPPVPTTAHEPTDEQAKLTLQALNYESYLQVPELLKLQHRLSEPAHHDELFFIVIHQAFELWFLEMLHETDLLVEHLQGGAVSRALKVLKRLNAIMELLVRQIELLATLTPVEFGGFRDHLKPASGFQSVQYRELEFAYGNKDPFFLSFFADRSYAHERLARRLETPSVYHAFWIALRDGGFPVPGALLERTGPGQPHAAPKAVADSDGVAVLKELYEHPGTAYHWVLLCEAMLDFDTLFADWRRTHQLMVERTIGTKPGTGGSSGAEFLKTRLDIRFFPELWAVRAAIGEGGY